MRYMEYGRSLQGKYEELYARHEALSRTQDADLVGTDRKAEKEEAQGMMRQTLLEFRK